MIRIIVAEDSSTARALILEVLTSDPEIQVVGEARTGVEAVELALQLRPDLITMDIEMPLMDGLEAARTIMERIPTPIVVVSSSTNRSESDRSMDAMTAGVLYVIDKPNHPFAEGFDDWGEQLLSAVKAMAHVKVVRRIRRRGEPMTPPPLPSGNGEGPSARLVAIGASTGGPAVLTELLRQLPADFPLPILLVQHIARGFAEALASWLRGGCKLRVKVAEHREPLRGGTVYLAPDDVQLGVADGMIVLSAGPKVGPFRPSATYLFDSAARAYGRSLVAVILTGMGTDGVEGLRRVRDLGGKVFAQDEESCVVFGMPREAIRAGIVDHVLDPAGIAGQLRILARRQ